MLRVCIQKAKVVASLVTLSLLLSSCGNSPVAFDLFEESESFAQAIKYNQKVDILVVVDNSGSMADRQDALATALYPFIINMARSTFDFRLAVTTMDMSSGGERGRFVGNPTVLTKTTPSLSESFQNQIKRGVTGSDLSRGLEALESALSPGMLAGANAGFWRDDAYLVIMFLSDEEDISSGSPSDYINFLNSVKPPFEDGSPSWVVHSVVVTEASAQCTTRNRFSSIGNRYMALSRASNGLEESICSPSLEAATTRIKKRILEQITEYRLQREPQVDTIRVIVDGVLIPQDENNGWTYHEEGYVIRFHGSAVPGENAVVNIDYKPATVKKGKE